MQKVAHASTITFLLCLTFSIIKFYSSLILFIMEYFESHRIIFHVSEINGFQRFFQIFDGYICLNNSNNIAIILCNNSSIFNGKNRVFENAYNECRSTQCLESIHVYSFTFFLILNFKNRSGRPADDELDGFSGLADDNTYQRSYCNILH